MSSRKPNTALNMADAMTRARGITQILTAGASRIEAARELPQDILKAMHDARMFRLLLPKSLGGDELDLKTHSEVIELIATADASTAWVMGQGAGCAMAAGYLDAPVAKRLFGPANAVLAWGAGIQGKAVAVKGGYQVTGTWTFASGSRHATLLGGHSYVFEADGTPRRTPDGRQADRTALFTRDKAIVHDVWHTVGLKGTGSDTFEVRDLFVPEEETVDRDKPAERRETGTLFKFATTLAYAAGFSGLMLGIARGQLDELRTLAMTKTQRGAATSLRESPVFQLNLAVLEARQQSARAFVNQTLTELWQTVDGGGELTLDQRAQLKLATTYAINQGAEIVTECYRAAGQTAIFPSNRFEQRLRDALTASQQAQGRPTNYVTIGRMFMGLPPDSMMFL